MIKPKTPIFFRKEAMSLDTPTNATYIRSMGYLNHRPVCEIEYRQDKWIVGESECHTMSDALGIRAKKLNAMIEGARTRNPKPEAMARALNMSLSTLKKRMKFVTEFLQK